MCYAGGPYCYEDTAKAYMKSVEDYRENPSTDNKKKVDEARSKIEMTPHYIEALKRSNPEAGQKKQEEYDSRLSSAKKYQKINADNKKKIKTLKQEQSKLEAISTSLQSKRDELESKKDYEVEHRLIMLKDYDNKLESANNRIGTINNQVAVLKQSNKENLQNHKDSKPMNYSHMMPAQFKDYFASTEKKHFNPESPGSTFTEAKNLNEVLALAHQQRGTLEGNDRDELIKHGASPDSFQDDKRYIMVKTNGKLGSVSAKSLPEDTKFTVHQKAEGVKPVLVAEVDKKPNVNVATIVMVDNPTLKGTEHHSTLLITAYPGVSTSRGDNEGLLPYVGKEITMKQAREIFGRDDFSVNTQLKK